MSGAFASGLIIDVALALVGLEVFTLWILLRRRAPRLRPLDLVAQVFAGVFLLLAVRSALTGAHWAWCAGFLLASFPAHLWDVHRRYTLAPG